MRFIHEFLTRKEGSRGRDLLFLLVTFGIAFLQTLGRLPLLEPDEGRYAEIPREMLERGDFITPLLDYVKYFEKPPLHYWLNAASMAVFGRNEFAARLPGALAGLICVLFTYHLGRALFDRRTGLFAALVLGTSTGFLVQARINFTDMTLTCCLTAALGCFIIAARDDAPRQGPSFYLSYLFAALAVLAKGLIGIVFPGAIVFLYCLLGKRWRTLREMRPVTGLLLFLLAAAPWFVLVSARNPEFPRFFFIHEHFERFTTTVHGRYQPPWFFIPVLLGTMLPWSFFIPAGLRGSWRDRFAPQGREALYLAIWAVFIFLFFSKSDSKLVPYILPVFPPLAVLIGRAFSARLDGAPAPLRKAGAVLATIFVILGIGLIVYPHVTQKNAFSPIDGLVMGSLFLVEGAAAFACIRRDRIVSLFVTLCACSYLIGIVAPPLVLRGVIARKTARELALIVRQQAGPDDVVASFGYEQTLPFYTARRTVVVGGMGELEFGAGQGDQSAWFLDLPRFARLWDGERRVFALATAGDLDQLRKSVTAPVRELARNKRCILITNR